MTFFKNEGQYRVVYGVCMILWVFFIQRRFGNFWQSFDNFIKSDTISTSIDHRVQNRFCFITFPNIILNFRTLCTSLPRPTYYLGHLFRLHDKNTALHTRHIWINVITKLIIQSIIKLHDLEDKLHPLQEIKSKSEWWSKL